jgi:hypothetical protein
MLPHKLIIPFPFKVLSSIKGSISWNNESARFCINEIFREINRKSHREGLWSWHIRRAADPNSPFDAVLDIHIISSSSLNSTPWHMRIEATRPLAEAMRTLEEIFRYTITYEDPPYLCPCDIIKNQNGEAEMPSGGIISFSYSPDWELNRIIQSCLAAYHDVPSNTGIFMVKKANDIFHVFPIHIKNENGSLTPYESILDKPISISVSNKRPVDVLEIICSKTARQSNKIVRIGRFPRSIFLKGEQSFNISGRSARAILTEFIKSVNGDLSWQLLYNPKSKEYILNIHDIKEPRVIED